MGRNYKHEIVNKGKGYLLVLFHASPQIHLFHHIILDKLTKETVKHQN